MEKYQYPFGLKIIYFRLDNFRNIQYAWKKFALLI